MFVHNRMKTTLFESFPGTCPAGISLLRVSALELLWHPWVPPHDLASINKNILLCGVTLIFFLICATTVPFGPTSLIIEKASLPSAFLLQALT